jgi:uncharacterized membrane protein
MVSLLVVVIAAAVVITEGSNDIFPVEGRKSRAPGATHKTRDNSSMEIASHPWSPMCWRSATGIFDNLSNDSTMDATEICAILPEHQQKRLSLEIARCHLQDLGKSMMKNQAAEDDCSPVNGRMADLDWCLKNLSDTGISAYTHYIMYVQQLCIRLTQDFLFRQQQAAQQQISAQYADISGKSIIQMRTLQQITREHTDQMKALSAIPDQVRERLNGEIQAAVRVTLQESLRDELERQLALQLAQQLDGQFSRLLQEQAVEQASFVANILGNFESRERDHKELYEKWSNSQSSMWQKHAGEMKRQQKQMDDHRAKVESLSDTVQMASRTMQPLLGLQALMKTASEGYSWLALMLHFLATFNIAWLLTRPSRCSGFRWYVYYIVFAATATDIAILCMLNNGIITKAERLLLTTELRQLSYVLECAIYLLGLFASFFFVRRKEMRTDDFAANLETQRALLELKEQHGILLQRLQAPPAMSIHHEQGHGNAPGPDTISPNTNNVLAWPPSYFPPVQQQQPFYPSYTWQTSAPNMSTPRYPPPLLPNGTLPGCERTALAFGTSAPPAAPTEQPKRAADPYQGSNRLSAVLTGFPTRNDSKQTANSNSSSECTALALGHSDPTQEFVDWNRWQKVCTYQGIVDWDRYLTKRPGFLTTNDSQKMTENSNSSSTTMLIQPHEFVSPSFLSPANVMTDATRMNPQNQAELSLVVGTEGLDTRKRSATSGSHASEPPIKKAFSGEGSE